MANEHLHHIYKTIVNEVDIGIHVINANGETVIYNSKMMDIESLSKEDVLHKHFLDVFTFEEGETSTLLDVLREKRPRKNVKQTYFNHKGKEITTVNHTFPIFYEDELIGAIEIAKDVTNLERLIRENIKQKGNTTFTFDSIIGKSHSIREVIEHTKRATRTPSSVLIVGETGTGKELFAQSIHNGSERSSAPFISQNCAAIPDTLIESILFGTKKGAFTGSLERPGLFEEAEGGTLFLDEINSLSPMLQAKLLRAIQEKVIRRVGDTIDRKVNVRIVSTINEDPIEAIANGRLRKDLYYRLSVVSIFVPPLRERKEDIPLLASHFIKKYNHLFQMNVQQLHPDVMHLFNDYDWPGNVRELEHVIEGAMNLVVDDTTIHFSYLPVHFRNKSIPKDGPSSSSPTTFVDKEELTTTYQLKDYLHEAETYFIKKALIRHKYHVTNTAKELGLSRQALQYRMKRLHIRAK
ncbi:sigma 54-interacting transcriptional regulator [Alkalihalobacillus sp. LMS39]|uniref:sigma-54 interaction domain-containing protein n=1 Tax=Alkalihalobacillus sp. LMS39 TaxID=2924032 RepID=UPI0024363B6F|nr:sigma 54-interacting transcriptional regulator [Alkalihalobacillus sp. LMS39]